MNDDTKKIDKLKHHPQLIEFYTKERTKVDHLYKSEKKFLPYAAEHSSSVLDTGCAAGGFRDIYKHFNSEMSYTGVDISESLINEARKIHPECRFEVTDCSTENSKFAKNEFDLVSALGWLNWELDWIKALTNLWSWSNKYILFDVRMGLRAETGKQKIELTSEWDGTTITPYIVVDYQSLSNVIKSLKPKSVWVYGYKGKPSDSVEGVGEEVCFTAFLLHKQDKVDDCVELPIELNIDIF